MTLLDSILSALGLGGGRAADRDAAEPTTTVEHEPDAADEAAVKGADAGSAEKPDATPDTPDETEPTETSGVDAAETTEPADETEPTETSGVDAAETTEPADETEPTGTSGVDAAETADPADEGPGSEPVETVKGIGSAYAEKLETADVETVADLADADADDLAERTSLSATRVERWIERARVRRDA